MEKGILTKAVEAKLATTLDELVKVEGIWEAIDGMAFKLAISALDDNLGEKIPEPYKEKLRQLFNKILEEENYEEAVYLGFEFLDEIVNVPGIDDDMEAMLFDGLARIVVAVIVQLKK